MRISTTVSFLGAIEAALESGRLIPVYHAVSGHSEGTQEACSAPSSRIGASNAGQGRSGIEHLRSGPCGIESGRDSDARRREEGVPFCEVCEASGLSANGARLEGRHRSESRSSSGPTAVIAMST